MNAPLAFQRKLAEGADRSTTHHAKTDQPAAALFLRQPSRPNPARPEAKSKAVGGSGTTENCEVDPKSPDPQRGGPAHQIPVKSDRKTTSSLNGPVVISTFAGPGRFCKSPLIEKISPGGGGNTPLAPLNDRESRFEV